jgi:hypothetical protein
MTDRRRLTDCNPLSHPARSRRAILCVCGLLVEGKQLIYLTTGRRRRAREEERKRERERETCLFVVA